MFQCFISNLHEDIASIYVSQNMKILNILYNLIFTLWEREREREREMPMMMMLMMMQKQLTNTVQMKFSGCWLFSIIYFNFLFTGPVICIFI